MRARWMAITCAAAVLGVAAWPAAGQASAAGFSGSCSFGGPIQIGRPITVVPVLGAHFSYAGSGTCSGTLDGSAVTAAPITVSFDNVSTLFDTCELGPDLNLNGTMKIGGDAFAINVNLARVAIAGPFLLSTPGGGLAAGIAQFTPDGDQLTAAEQCLGQGVAGASLSGNFSTITPL